MFDFGMLEKAQGIFGGGAAGGMMTDAAGESPMPAVAQIGMAATQPNGQVGQSPQPTQNDTISEAARIVAGQPQAPHTPAPQSPAVDAAKQMQEATAPSQGTEVRDPAPAIEDAPLADSVQNVEDTITQFGGADGQRANFMNSNLRKTVKKVASAVAAFYTGGLSSAAMNVGSNLVSENNPQAGAIASAAGKAFGGGGGGSGFGGF